MERHQRIQLKTTSRSIDQSFQVSPFRTLGFGVQQKSASIPASKAELWENYQRSSQITQQGAGQTRSPIQTKLTIGQPGDKYEQEADSVADRVMAMSEPAQVQREELGEEEEELQMKPLAETISPLVQREELPEEEEELQMKPEDRAIQREELPEEEEELQMKSLDNSIQREALPEEEEELQMKESPTPNSQLPTDSLEDRLSSSKGGGSPLSDDVRSFMEPRFGADFSGVRVHTGSDAVQMNRDVSAQAFAHGSDVYFGAGKAPGKDVLTAHELTHVVQQNGGIQNKPISDDKTIIQRDITNPTVTSGQTTPHGKKQLFSPQGICLTPRGFKDHCAEANTILDESKLATIIWLESIAGAYGDAWKNHTDLLNEEADSERLFNDLILGAALAFVPGGIGGLVSKALTTAKRGDFIIEGLTDLVKYGVTTAGAKSLGSGGQGLNAFPIEPMKWKSQVSMKITSEALVATKTLKKWQHSANQNDPNFAMDFDPALAMTEAVIVQGQKAADLKPFDEIELAKDIEKGFWKGWLEINRAGFDTSADDIIESRLMKVKDRRKRFGRFIERRCKSLGLNIEEYALPQKSKE
jgi:Domain of unknown function (DUF4157)